MGLAASQARLLTITARLADNELRSQTINNAKMRLATQSSQASEDYVSALNNARLMFTNTDANGLSQTQVLNFNNLTAFSPYNTQYGLVNSAGLALVSEKDAKAYEDSKGNLTEFLEAQGLDWETTFFDDKEDEYGNKVNDIYTKLTSFYGTGTTTDGTNTTYDLGYLFNDLDRTTPNEQHTNADFKTLYEKNDANNLSLENINYLDLAQDVVNYIANIYSTAHDGFEKLILENNESVEAFVSTKTTETASYNATTTYLSTLISSTNATSCGTYLTETGIENLKEMIGSLTDQTTTTPPYFLTSEIEFDKSTSTVSGTTYTWEYDDIKISSSANGGSGTYTITVTSGTDGYLYYNNTSVTPTTTTDGTTTTYTYTYATPTGTTPTFQEVIMNINLNSGTTTSQNLRTTFRTYTTTKTTTTTITTSTSATTSTTTTTTTIICTATTVNSPGNARQLYQEFIKRFIEQIIYSKSYFSPLKYMEENGMYNDSSVSTFQATYGIELKDISDYSIITDFKTLMQMTGKDSEGNNKAYGLLGNSAFQNVVDAFKVQLMVDVLGEPKYTWVDKNDINNTSDASAKAQWYTNLFNRMQKGYRILEDGLASSSKWLEYAFESGLVGLEQVDKSYNWNALSYSTCACITEETDSSEAVAIAEAKYKRAMNDIEQKDKMYDLQLKNIDTEHSSLQIEYDSIKGVINKNIERTIKFDQSA